MLRPHERDVLDRIERNGNPIGWKPWGRDEEGNAVMRAEIPIPGGKRLCEMVIAPAGLTTVERMIPDA